VLFLIGMGMAGLADIIDVRIMIFISALILLGAGIWVLFLPGLGQPAAEWQRALRLLRAAPSTSQLGLGHAATVADLDGLFARLPAMGVLGARERQSLMKQSSVVEAPAGTTIVAHGDPGDAAYFLLDGAVVVGRGTPDGSFHSLSELKAGDFFGEIAALTGATRTANVVASEPVKLLQVPSAAMRELMAQESLSRLFLSTMTERLARTSIYDLPRFTGLDQNDVRELRSAPPPSSADLGVAAAPAA
jgi:CRP-like cAMP-binding protein